MNRVRGSKQRGFTLVELLVVIGIIAVLIGILLPVFSKARQAAQTAKCLANLHSIGHAMVTYSIDNKGYNIPCYANGQGYWFNILVNLGYLTAPDSTTATGPVTSRNIFFCPAGSQDVTPFANTAPTARDNNTPDVGFRSPSPLSGPVLSTIDCWYAINGCASGGPVGGQSYSPDLGPPFHSIWDINDDPQNKPRYAFVPSVKIRRASEMVAIYDGLIYNMFVVSYSGGMSGNEYRLSARHNNKTRTNILFVDGHADSFPTADLPGGLNPGGGSTGADFSIFNLQANYPPPAPQWRLDMPQ